MEREYTVECEDGDIITGYIIHWVDGYHVKAQTKVIGLSLSHQHTESKKKSL